MLRWQVLLWKMRAGLIQLQSIADFAVGPVCELNFEGQRLLFETKRRARCQSQVVVTSSGEGAYGIHPPAPCLLPTNTDAGNEEVRKLKNWPPEESGAWEGFARLQGASGGGLRHRMSKI